jgi:hypothetical protein
MSDREAFEKWWPSVGQTIGKVAAWEAWQAVLQSGEPVALERVEAYLETDDDEVRIVIEPDPQGSLVYYDNVVRVMQATPQPVVADEKWATLYNAINPLVCYIGAYGEIDSHNDLVHAVMDALKEIDGGTFTEMISIGKEEV